MALRAVGRVAAFILFIAAAELIMPRYVAATVLTFTDRGAWEAAVVGFTEETFDAFTTDQSFNNGSTVDVGDFTLTGFGDSNNLSEVLNRVDASPFSSLRPSPNGTTDLVVHVDDRFPLGFNILFDQPILAWGSDFGETGSEFRVSATGSVIGQAVSNGFFGFVDTMATFTMVTIDTPTGFNGAATTMDNFVYSDQLVPEPATLALLGLGLAGIGFSRKRRRH